MYFLVKLVRYISPRILWNTGQISKFWQEKEGYGIKCNMYWCTYFCPPLTWWWFCLKNKQNSYTWLCKCQYSIISSLVWLHSIFSFDSAMAVQAQRSMVEEQCISLEFQDSDLYLQTDMFTLQTWIKVLHL